MATPDEKNSSTTETPIKPETNQTHKSATLGGLWFFTLLNLSILAALIGGSIWFYFYDLESRIATTTSAVEQTFSNTGNVNALLQWQHVAREQLATLQQSDNESSEAKAIAEDILKKANQTLDAMQSQLDELQLAVSDMEGRRPSDWLIAEADYLVRLAGRKVWLEQDTTSAIMLLTAADARLAGLNDPSLLTIRQLIMDDIQTLKQLNPISLTSVGLSLSALVAQVDKLPLATLRLPKEIASTDTEEVSHSVSDWQDNLARVWRSIVDDFITIRRREEPVEPMMTEQAQWFVKEQLRFALMQAKTAALSAQPTLYQQSLQPAISTLVDNFELDAREVDQFSAALQNLQQTNVERQLPAMLTAQQPLSDKLGERINRLFNNTENSI